MSRWVALASVLLAIAAGSGAKAADKLVLQLHGPAQFEFAGYYAALWKGFYREAGLNIEIKPGSGRGQQSPIDPVREVTEGRAQFGTGTAELAVRAAQGLPLLLLAPIFQQSGAAVYYRADADFASPATLAKARLGRLPASNILDIELATAMRAEGVDAAKIKSVPIEPDQAIAGLADRSIEAAPGSAWEAPWIARDKGLAIKSFNPANYRVEFYGDTLFTLRRLAKAEAQTVRGFRTASLKGWEYALDHPEEIASRLVAELPAPTGVSDIGAFARYQSDLARRLSRYPEVSLGHTNPDRWDRIQASMIGVGALLRTAEPDDFIYDPDAEQRNRADLRSITIIGATLAVGIAVIVWLWWNRRRAPAPAATALAAGTRVMPAAPSARPPQREPADLNLLLGRIERTLRQRVPRRIKFRLSLLPELWRCRADPRAVRTLLLDLLDAAAGDVKADGELIVGTRNYAFDTAALNATPGAQLGDYVRITVRDNGAGLSEEALAKVFDPVATARPSAAAAATVLRAIGGFARVESAEGVGTAVHLYFPRVADAAAAKPAEAAE